MIPLDAISRIGFGAYRVSIRSRRHHAALLHALRCGCTLVDTASTYTNGESEQLVGQVVRENPALDFFLVTKAGYPLGAGEKHSLAPDFLQARLQASMQRIARPQIDGFLLHNPENAFADDAGGLDGEAFEAALRQAFEFLEDSVRRGAVRYWGVSSNVLHTADGVASPARLHRLLRIAEAVSSTHHFRLIQFPFNLLESEAAQPASPESFLSLARRSGLRTIGNRPLNANGPLGAVRLATRAPDSDPGAPAPADLPLREFMAVVQRRLAALGSSDDPLQFTIVQFLRDTWTTLSEPEQVHAIFRERLAPFVACLYPDGLPADDRAFFERFEAAAVAQARQNMSDAARRLRGKLAADGLIAAGDPRPLAEIAVDHGLKAGVQHVLVGMRDPAYVDALRHLF